MMWSVSLSLKNATLILFLIKKILTLKGLHNLSGGFVLHSNLLPFSAENIFLDVSGIMHPRQPMDGDD